MITAAQTLSEEMSNAENVLVPLDQFNRWPNAAVPAAKYIILVGNKLILPLFTRFSSPGSV
jgi:hypothetical protein